MKSLIAVASALLLLLLVTTCSNQPDDRDRTNPYDFGGTSLDKENQPPESLTILTSYLAWQNFDQTDSLGDLTFAYTAYDPNEPFDTLSYAVYEGSSASGLSLIHSGRDTICLLRNVKSGSSLYYRIVVTDLAGDSLDSSGVIKLGSKLPPSAPTSLTATSRDSSVLLSFACVSSATSYGIYRASRVGGPFVRVAAVTSTCSSAKQTYTDYEVPDYELRYYFVSSISNNGESRGIDTVSGKRYDSARPLSVAASDGLYGSFIYVTWSATGSAFEVQRRDDTSATFRIIDTVSTLGFQDTVSSPRTYCYRIVALGSPGDRSEISAEDCGYLSVAQPATPTSVTASDGVYSNFINVIWSGTGSDFEVQRRLTNSLVYTAIDTTTQTRFKDYVTTAETYCYRVVALGFRNQRSAESAEECGYVTQQSAPTNVVASDGLYARFVYVTWSGTGTSYEVQRRDSSSTTFRTLSTVTTSFFRDTVPTAGSYCYRIVALGGRAVAVLPVPRIAVTQFGRKRPPM